MENEPPGNARIRSLVSVGASAMAMFPVTDLARGSLVL